MLLKKLTVVFEYYVAKETYSRILLEGWKVLFRVSVGFFKMVQSEMIEMNFETLMQSKKTMTRSFVKHNE